MKKTLLAAFAVIVLTASSACARDRITRDVNELPAAAQTCLRQSFPKNGVNHIKVDDHFMGGADYDVVLNDGTEVEFNSKGEVKEVCCGRNATVPANILPEGVTEYVRTNFPNDRIVKVDFERSRINVELSNDLDLDFDRNGRFLRYDD